MEFEYDPSLLHIKFESKFSKMILSKDSLLSSSQGFCDFLKINRKNSLTCWQKTIGDQMDTEVNHEVTPSTNGDTSSCRKRKLSARNEDSPVYSPNKFIKTEITEPVQVPESEPVRIKEEPMDPVIAEPESALFSEANEPETLEIQKVESHKPMKTENVKPEMETETALFNDDDNEPAVPPALSPDIVKSIKVEECTGDGSHKYVMHDTYVELEDDVVSFTEEIVKLMLNESIFPCDSDPRPTYEILEDYWKEYNLPVICKKCNSHRIWVDANFRLFVRHFVDPDTVQDIYTNMSDHMKQYDFQTVVILASQKLNKLKAAEKQ